jgi:hypothetical protein
MSVSQVRNNLYSMKWKESHLFIDNEIKDYSIVDVSAVKFVTSQTNRSSILKQLRSKGLYYCKSYSNIQVYWNNNIKKYIISGLNITITSR